MITQNTVLILGAGASIPFGFPSGTELIQEILQYRNGPVERGLFQLLNVSDQDIAYFQNALVRSGTQSIDEFLEDRADLISLGKHLIAITLGRHETDESLFAPELKGKNWYDYLFNKMVGCSSLQENKIAFVTYNYDRSLEYYLWNVLTNRYKLSASDAVEQILNVPIIHIHGQLGSILRTKGHNPYQPITSLETLQNAAQAITIIHEAKEDDNMLHARKLLKEARTIAFLGFGYHRTNMVRLKMGDCSQAEMFGTFYGMSETETVSVGNSFSPKHFHHHPGAILEALRDWGILEAHRPKVFSGHSS